MHREAQKTQCFSVAQTLYHERFHAYVFHVIGHFKLEFAKIAHKFIDALSVRLQSLQS
jgi:hypothetical protein